jgi:hypothetical protein
MKNKFKIFLFGSLIYLLFDFLITNLFLKNTEIWKSTERIDHYWRIKSEIYHHDIMPNVEVVEPWQKFNKKLITNSIGFRDFSKKKILKENLNQKRILLIGDSFIEGAGYDYQFTIGGLIQNKVGKNIEVLNSAVGSYSPGIYYLKTKYYIDQGYKFDYALIFLDLSDIVDEQYLKYNSDYSKIVNYYPQKPLHKKIFYKTGEFLSSNTLLFKFLLNLSDQTEVIKKYIKLKYKASKEFEKSFFKTSQEDTLLLRMLIEDRGYWTFNEKKFLEVQKGLQKSKFFLKKLNNLLVENNVKTYLIVYPWPAQILYGDSRHQVYWEKFSNENNINFINLYDQFKGDNKREVILNNFIYGDIHWNKNGNHKILEGLSKNRIFEEISSLK